MLVWELTKSQVKIFLYPRCAPGAVDVDRAMDVTAKPVGYAPVMSDLLN
jgi:hypothetical protein